MTAFLCPGTAEIIRGKGYSNYWYKPAGDHGYSGTGQR
jgi:hypothetical protein